MGPTASGKSALAMALAERFGGEIVTRRFGAGLPRHGHRHRQADAGERARVPHHLIDIVDPTEAYSAARFVARCAAPRSRDIRARGRVPILAGGTMLYFKALTEGLSALPRADPDVRASSTRAPRAKAGPRCTRSSRASIRRRRARLPPTDAQRIQRALEVHRV